MNLEPTLRRMQFSNFFLPIRAQEKTWHRLSSMFGPNPVARFSFDVQEPIAIGLPILYIPLQHQLSMKHKNLLFAQFYHLASTSYASLFCSISCFEILNTSSSAAVKSLSAKVYNFRNFYRAMLFP